MIQEKIQKNVVNHLNLATNSKLSKSKIINFSDKNTYIFRTEVLDNYDIIENATTTKILIMDSGKNVKVYITWLLKRMN